MRRTHDFAFAISDRLQNVAEIFIRKIDIQIFEWLKETLIVSAMKNDLGTRDHYFVAFAPHLFDQDRDLHFATGIDLKCASGFGIGDLKRNVASRFPNESLANVARSHEFSFSPSKWGIIHENSHADCRRIDIDKLKRLSILGIGECFTDINSFKT